MSVKRHKSSQPDTTEIEEIIFPEEVWILIWSYLDFETIQKTCTQVSKSWLEMIRNSKLSWEMRLQFKLDLLEVEDFNDILDHWKNLRAIHFKSELAFAKFQLSLKSHKSLKKIVISSGPYLYDKESPFDPLGVVIKYWINPRHLLTEKDTIKNVIEMEMKNVYLKEFDMRQKDWELTNLETLSFKIFQRSIYETAILNPELLFRFKNLKKLEISIILSRGNDLLNILRFLGNTKNVKISASLKLISSTDKEETKKIFNQALQIVKEKFPFPDVRILDLDIYEGSWMNSIHYGKSGATLSAYNN
jgi:hypothetical protein